jgi:predicted secreted Zn-dependent protease
VTSSTTTHTYAVDGGTALGLVRYMNSHPVQGDHGAAYASIHPNYELSVVTAQRGSKCVPLKVSVNVDFDLTVPVADSPGRMSGRTRAAWNAFTAFARGHESHHKASYLGCARAFVARARRQSAGECVALEFDLRTMLSQMKRDCETRQMAFDHVQARILPRLALFRMARQQAAQ